MYRDFFTGDGRIMVSTLREFEITQIMVASSLPNVFLKKKISLGVLWKSPFSLLMNQI